MTVASVHLSPKISPRVERGHPWIYANEVASVEGDIHPADIVRVFNAKNRPVGTGYINPLSQILVRLLSRSVEETIDTAFFEKRIQAAWEYRKKVGLTRNCRVIFSEADFLPGLIIDKFGDYFAIQTLTAGMDRWKPSIIAILEKLFEPKGIYERNDVPVRALEGLEEKKGILGKTFDPRIVMEENGLKFGIDLEHGQKTGFFLDQRDNWNLLKDISVDADVLDCCTYRGAFAFHAAKFGAKSVLGLDVSEDAVEACRENARMNNLEDICSFETANVFDALNTWAKEKRKFDVIILDPPAFTKNRAGLHGAQRGYKDINLRAMQMLRLGGFLLTCSCSRFMTPDLFQKVIHDAARDAGKILRQVAYGLQGKDHPILWNVEETSYLKSFLLQIL